jgi:Tol biopolymer transport system component
MAGGKQQLTTDSNSNYGVRWSPEGTHISYSSDKENSFKTFKLSADGSGNPVKLSSR